MPGYFSKIGNVRGCLAIYNPHRFDKIINNKREKSLWMPHILPYFPHGGRIICGTPPPPRTAEDDAYDKKYHFGKYWISNKDQDETQSRIEKTNF